MHKNKEMVFEAVRKLAISKGTSISKERIQIYAEYLERYDANLVLKALEKLFRESRFFPDISEIINLVDPKPNKKDDANELAGEIIGCISNYGPDRIDDVKYTVGEVGWFAIQKFGGWNTLCQIKTDELPIIRAQLRDVCIMALSQNEKGVNLQLDYLDRKKSGPGELKQVGDNKQGVLE